MVGTFLVSQAALPLLREADGRVDHQHHLARRDPPDRQLAAVRGVQGRARSPHDDHGQARRRRGAGERGRPGLVATPWTDDWDALKAGVTAIAPLHRVATADDIAEACVALVGLRYATGHTLVVDGGLGLVL